jgi:hypothetical protein
MAALGFYSIFTPACFWGLFRLARPSWQLKPRVPKVIAGEIPRGEWP